MITLSRNTKIYIGLIIVYAICAAIYIFLPQGSFVPTISEQDLPASKPVMALIIFAIVFVIYGGLGYLGLQLSKKLGFAEIWDRHVTNKQRFLIPVLIGAGLGLLIILGDSIFQKFNGLGPFPHPPFPTSIIASISAGIGEEVIFRLFFISFWVWLVSSVILKKRWPNQIFWIVATISALAFALGHLPSLMILTGMKTVSEIPAVLLAEIILLNGVLSMFAAYYFKKYGFLAAVGIHFWADIVWHVIWGMAG